MIAKHPLGAGENALAKSLQRFRRRRTDRVLVGTDRASVGADVPDCHADCSRPDASPDLPITHGLQLASIEARLTKLEQSVNNQNKLLLIGIIAVIGELAKSILKP